MQTSKRRALNIPPFPATFYNAFDNGFAVLFRALCGSAGDVGAPPSWQICADIITRNRALKAPVMFSLDECIFFFPFAE